LPKIALALLGMAWLSIYGIFVGGVDVIKGIFSAVFWAVLSGVALWIHHSL